MAVINVMIRLAGKIGVVILTLIATSVQASSTTGGNGDESYYYVYNPWFIGDETVAYCVENADSGTPMELLRVFVRDSLDSWIAFIKREGLDRKIGGEGEYQFKDGTARGLSLNFVEATSCNQYHDVKFLFGKPDEFIVANQNKWSSGWGLTVRRVYDEMLFLGGTVWVGKISGGQMLAILHHEVGHIFGFRHEAVFAMWNFSEKVRRNDLLNFTYNHPLAVDAPGVHYRVRNGEEQMVLLEDEGGYAPAEKLPAKLRVKLKSKFKSYWAKLQITAVSDTEIAATLKIKTDGNEELLLPGKFQIQKTAFAQDRKGPSYCGTIKYSDQIIGGCMPFEQGSHTLPVAGYFESNGEKFPAQLSNQLGQKMQIFVMDTGRWWSP